MKLHRILTSIGLIPVFGLVLSQSLWAGHETDQLDNWTDVESDHTCLTGKLEYAHAAASKKYDEATGQDLRHFPPDRNVDYLHMTLQMRFDDISDRRFTATESLQIKPLRPGVETIELDAVDLDIQSVTLKVADRKPQTTEFYHDGKRLTVRFDSALDENVVSTVIIDYICDQPTTGMTFTPYSPDAPNYTPEVSTQGQAEDNRYWFACHDFPNERMATELIVDVPKEFSVSSNGRLVSMNAQRGRAVWHYLQEKPHVSYLVSLVIGQFDIVEIDHPTVPMKIWAPRGYGHLAEQTYGRTGQMIDLFEEVFGVPYPWDRYDQLVIKNFSAGGMENTSVTSMHPSAILDDRSLLDGDMDGLISHELCHQWTGDYITCKSWAHIWLNEGWATYGANLWQQRRFGEDAYLDAMRRSFGVARRDRTSNEVGMVSPVYEGPWETFRRAANPYPKGASILHMLRKMLGDDVFFEGVHLYMKRHGLGLAETNDFRYALEDVSGMGLEWFFEQWCFRPGSPNLDVDIKYDPKSGDLLVNVEQTQQIDERTPAFRFTLPIYVQTSAGEQWLEIEVDQKTTVFRAALEGVPNLVAVDPDLHVLKTIKVTKPESMWREQLVGGPTIVARYEAINALSKLDTPQHMHMLVEIIRDDNERYTLRNAAVRALAGYASKQAKEELLSIVTDGVDEARVRSTLVGQLDEYDLEEVGDLLAEFAAEDESYDVQSAAISDLASLEAKDHADLLVELAQIDNRNTQVRNSALRALTEFDDERGLDLALNFATYGNMDRSRPTAIRSIGKLAHHDEDRAVDFLLELLNDYEGRTVRSAMSALAEVGDERGLDPLRDISKTHRDEDMREAAERSLKRLQKKIDEADDDKEDSNEG